MGLLVAPRGWETSSLEEGDGACGVEVEGTISPLEAGMGFATGMEGTPWCEEEEGEPSCGGWEEERYCAEGHAWVMVVVDVSFWEAAVPSVGEDCVQGLLRLCGP